MPDRTLPGHPNLEQYKKQAKELRRSVVAGTPAALERIRRHHPRFRHAGSDSLRSLSLADAQLVLAREHGYGSWPEFAKYIETLRVIRELEDLRDPVHTFIQVASVDRHGWHGSGTLEHAEMIRARYPEVSTASIYSAALLGDATTVRAFLSHDSSLATAKGGPHGWDALTYLCFSRYLRIDKARSESFVLAARALLEAGANANTGWTEYIDTPARPVHEAALYGVAGVAQHVGLTGLLLAYGADPNDEETPYHVAETYDNTVLQVLLDSGRFNEVSLATVAARKCDWHDDKGLNLVLDHGANPNYRSNWKFSPFQQSIRRDNSVVMIEALLDHGADPRLPNELDGRNAFQMSAWYGRDDILEILQGRGFETRLQALDALVATCARGDLEGARSLASRNPEQLTHLLAMGGTLLAHFAGANNDPGVRCLLALGVSPQAPWPEGDGYWELVPGSTALHVAAWRANHEVVKTLIAAGAPVNAGDARGRTALRLAVKACIDSYWKYRRKPDSVAALLSAGARIDGIDLPTGYSAIDELLVAQGNEDPGLNYKF
ncbi:MAG TPA: ankyrin repeat domain-containing protein [Terriglobia bacterium]|nr:ankyrin repeat domain-containing protein [Terriglobia bacterium]